jgi:hypothetical protein
LKPKGLAFFSQQNELGFERETHRLKEQTGNVDENKGRGQIVEDQG